MSRNFNFCIVIPAYNEERRIEGVVRKCLEECKNVVVVDDGSTDLTAEVAHNAGAVVLKHPANAGKTVALNTGFKYALEEGCDYVVTLDADGQHNPLEIKNFLEEARLSRADIIVGTRMAQTENMPLIRRLTNWATSRVLSRIIGVKLTDSQCGFRMIKRDVLENVRIDAKKYEGESEILIKAARKGYIIKEVPISTIYGDEKSKIKPLRDTYRFIRLALKYLQKKNE